MTAGMPEGDTAAGTEAGEGVSFFTVSDRSFFVGTVALLNSLRLTGNTGELVVLDLGLEAVQRERLATRARVVSPPAEIAENPLLSKPFAHLLDPAGVVVIVDSDMIITGPLDELVERAQHGAICLFSDHEAQRDRWFAEWESALALSRTPRREAYLNSGFVAFSTSHWPDLLRSWWQACAAIPSASTRAYGAPYEQPFWDGDQDALNAVLMAEVPAGVVEEQSQVQAPTGNRLSRVRVLDERKLSCVLGPTPTRLLHQTGRPKPWEAAAWMKARDNAYTRLAPRVLTGGDVVLALSPGELPFWLRPGPASRISLRALGALNATARAATRRVPADQRHRVVALRRRLTRAPALGRAEPQRPAGGSGRGRV